MLNSPSKYKWIVLCPVIALIACEHHKTGRKETEGDTFGHLQEVQLTYGEKGHFLHTVQAFSPDDSWLVYDTRNDDTHIGRTCCIEMVHVDSLTVKRLYHIKKQTEYGPGVGAVTFNPKRNQVLFIHGLPNSNKDRPYGFSRRTGVSLMVDTIISPPIFMDARDVIPPFTPGALRGGTHAHTWSPDGNWVSFTYNDALFAELSAKGNQEFRDLRMVGVMAPLGEVDVDRDDIGENINGKMFSVIVTEVTENPKWGSDQIDRAYGDGWIGEKGYFNTDGTHQHRAVGFLGDTRDENGQQLTEVFVVDIPDDVRQSGYDKPIEGRKNMRPMPPTGTKQRRVTHTQNRKFPGVQGPRHAIRSHPDGSNIYFMMKDSKGVVQVYEVSVNGGKVRQVTTNEDSIETSFDLSPDGNYLAYGIDQQIHITEVTSGRTRKFPIKKDSKVTGLRSINWSNRGDMIAYNRMVSVGGESYFQIFVLKTVENGK